MATAIITGITGQMGSYFAELLHSNGIEVVGAVRRLSVPNLENLNKIPTKDIIFEMMDLGDSHSIDRLITKYKPDYFINCAANSFVGSSWDCPEQHFEFNTLGVLRQLESIRKNSPNTRYVNFGSSEEFGDVQYSPQDEQHPPRARSPYGASKVAARQIVKVYRESYNLYAIQCYCYNYESPRRGHEFVTRKITLGVARIKKAIDNGEEFEPIVLGNLNSKRDWSHAEDIADGVWKMLNQDTPNEYILSSGEEHTIREFIERSFKIAGIYIENVNTNNTEPIKDENAHQVNYALTSGPPVVVVSRKFYRPAEVNALLGGSTKARQELNWHPKYTFEDLIKEMVENDINLLQ